MRTLFERLPDRISYVAAQAMPALFLFSEAAQVDSPKKDTESVDFPNSRSTYK